jgi:translation initiation factor IF-2
LRPAARAPAAEKRDEGANGQPKAAPARPEPPRSRPERIAPAPQNVPERPKVVTPAGPRLESKSPVKLSGPKVVRIEAPEPMPQPRARRDGGGRSGPVGGGGAGAGVLPLGPGEDDRGRSPRRSTRRGGPGGAGGGGGGGDRGRRGGGGAGGDRGEGLGTGIFREQDLLEREARLQRAPGYLKQRRRQQKARQSSGAERAMTPAQGGGAVKIAAPFTIKDLSAATGVKVPEIVKKLFLQGVQATTNSVIEPSMAQEIMIDYNIELDVTSQKTAEETVSSSFEERQVVDERPRSPVVTILGHVDHGKTSLLDYIRKTEVAAGEAGGITQATSAFRVPVEVGGETKHLVFLDTPGHQAFTEMRSRGATMTDIVVLVVAADDGVMPQTVESIAHAKAAEVPIVVALNKCDKPEATDAKINEIFGQLAEQGLNPVPWGGDIEVVKTSAVTGEGVEALLETLDLQGQLLELKADFGGPARGTVIESRMEEGRGAVANVLVQDGQMRVGDFIVVGRGFGRVRDIIDDRGQRLREVGPAHPVQISGFDELPDAGDKFYIVDSLKKAQAAAEQRRQRDRQAQLAQPKMTLDSLFSQMAESEVKEIRVVVKADVQGSVDVLKHEIEKITTEDVKVRVLHAAVGGITESDVLLAQASGAIIIGFNVLASGATRRLAEDKSVEIRTYQVIYHITDDIHKAAEGLQEPERREEVIGHAEVRAVFRISKVGAVAGCYVTNGVVQRDALIRVTRGGVVVENDRVLEQLKRVKDDVKEVRAGTECGMKIVGYDDIKEGDVLECYRRIEVKRTLGSPTATK